MCDSRKVKNLSQENGGTYIKHPVNRHDWNRLALHGIEGVWIALVDPEARNWNQQAVEQSILLGHRNQHYESLHGRVTVFYQNWGALELCLQLDIRIPSRSAQSRLILNRSPNLEGWRIFLSRRLQPAIEDFSELESCIKVRKYRKWWPSTLIFVSETWRSSNRCYRRCAHCGNGLGISK